ncbi:HpcH/HpaI aldolase/citrate lyase family protein [Mycobacterium sp. KBS0706]|uniref:HpcH/HpaI aldolase family protein n=1 Tax=Mycobacterium sp. KBS0706 TaxID=2578109 RepID=UPI0027D21FD7|nr:aldolase/citrate lyase family protein [Mycobacterium sp. KBS0706]
MFGAWVGSGSPTVAEIMAHAGFDFVILDTEHGPGGIDDTIGLLRAVQASDTPAVVRVPAHDPVWLKRVLDAGADSLMVPMIESAAEAEALVRGCRYPPAGRRGYAAGAVRASTYGFEPDYMRKANDNLLLLAQIESKDAVPEAAAIAQVDGIDMVFIGVNDLGGSIGLLEQLHDPRVQDLVRQIEDAVRPTGTPLGTVPSSASTWAELFDRGYRMVTGGGDVPYLRQAASDSVAAHKAYREGAGKGTKGGGY